MPQHRQRDQAKSERAVVLTHADLDRTNGPLHVDRDFYFARKGRLIERTLPQPGRTWDGTLYVEYTGAVAIHGDRDALSA
jgi:hypothetical protein